jgi:hypothetical protein
LLKPAEQIEFDLLEKVLDKSVRDLEEQQNRAAVMLINYSPQFGLIEYVSVGDMMLLHIREGAENVGDVADGSSDEKIGRNVGKFKSIFKRSQERKIKKDGKLLKLEGIIEQGFFDTVHSDFVGKNSVKSYKKGGMTVVKGDYLICLNRGVADSLYPDEVVGIVQQFQAQPAIDLSIDLDIMAGVITQKAFNKIVKYDEDRPLVKRIKTFLYDPKQVSVDECYCMVIKVDEAN